MLNFSFLNKLSKLLFENSSELGLSEADMNYSTKKYPEPGGASRESEQTIASREFKRNEKGEIYDVIFTDPKTGESKNLKDPALLPGDYTIKYFTKEEAAEVGLEEDDDIYDSFYNLVVVVEKERDDDLNLSILHEAGHAVDAQINQSNYSEIAKYNIVKKLKENGASIRENDLENNISDIGLLLESQSMEVIIENSTRKSREDLRNYFGDELYQSLIKESESFYEKLSETTSQEALTALKKDIDVPDADIDSRKAKNERNASTQGLNAYRTLKADGFYLYKGTNRAVITDTDFGLFTHEMDCLTPNVQFVKKRNIADLIKKIKEERAQEEQNGNLPQDEIPKAA